MNVKNTTGAYADCYSVMDQMLKRGGGRANFDSYKAAVVFRHRCYRARNILHKAAEKGNLPGMIPGTPYDDLYLVLEKDATSIEFKLRSKITPPSLEFEDDPKTSIDDLGLE